MTTSTPSRWKVLSFTAPAADTLFWTVASTSISATFGTGLVGGVLVGAVIASTLFGGFQWQSFTSPRETGRYAARGCPDGRWRCIAGGCTMGAGLSGMPTLVDRCPTGDCGNRCWCAWNERRSARSYSTWARIRRMAHHTKPTTGRVTSAVSVPVLSPMVSASGYSV